MLRLRGMLAAPAEPAGGLPLPEGPLDVEFRDLHFSYEAGTFALRDVDLFVSAGHTCALVGRTGSGKSTLASLLSRVRGCFGFGRIESMSARELSAGTIASPLLVVSDGSAPSDAVVEGSSRRRPGPRTSAMLVRRGPRSRRNPPPRARPASAR